MPLTPIYSWSLSSSNGTTWVPSLNKDLSITWTPGGGPITLIPPVFQSLVSPSIIWTPEIDNNGVVTIVQGVAAGQAWAGLKDSDQSPYLFTVDANGVITYAIPDTANGLRVCLLEAGRISLVATPISASDSVATALSESASKADTTLQLTVTDTCEIHLAFGLREFLVTDSLRVVVSEVASDTTLRDSVAVQLTELVTSIFIVTNDPTVVTKSAIDLLRVHLGLEGPPPIAKTASDSVRVTIEEPQDQATIVGPIDSLRYVATEATSLNVNGVSLTPKAATDSVAIQVTEVTTPVTSSIIIAKYVFDTVGLELVPAIFEWVLDSARPLTFVLNVADTLVLGLTEPRDTMTFEQVSDSLKVQATDVTTSINGAAPIAATDSLTAGLTETAALVSPLTVKASDLIAISLTEAPAILISFSVTDVLAVAGLEEAVVARLSVVAIATDGLTVQLTEASTLFSDFQAKSATDAVAAILTDVVTLINQSIVQLSTSDSVAIQVSGSAQIAISYQQPLTDQAAIALTEAYFLDRPQVPVEAIPIGLIETATVDATTIADIFLATTAIESGFAIQLFELTDLSFIPVGADELVSIQLTEVPTLVKLILVTDDLAIAVTEDASQGTRAIAATDSLAIVLTEAATLILTYDEKAASETLSIGLSEAATLVIIYDEKFASDSLSVGLSEASSLIFTYDEKTGSDAVAVHLSEVATIVIIFEHIVKAATDQVECHLTESDAIFSTVSASESIRLGLNDTAFPTYHYATSDEVAIQVSEQAIYENIMTWEGGDDITYHDQADPMSYRIIDAPFMNVW